MQRQPNKRTLPRISTSEEVSGVAQPCFTATYLQRLTAALVIGDNRNGIRILGISNFKTHLLCRQPWASCATYALTYWRQLASGSTIRTRQMAS